MRHAELIQQMRDLINGNSSSQEKRKVNALLVITQFLENYDSLNTVVLVDINLVPMPAMKHGGTCSGRILKTGQICGKAVREGDSGYLLHSRGAKGKVLCPSCGDSVANQHGIEPFFGSAE